MVSANHNSTITQRSVYQQIGLNNCIDVPQPDRFDKGTNSSHVPTTESDTMKLRT